MHRVSFSYGHQDGFSEGIVPVIKDWQNRVLNDTYSIIWLDTIAFNVRHNGLIQNRIVFSVLGVTQDGQMDLIGIYFADHENSFYWHEVLNDLKRRGIKKIQIACLDNIENFGTTIKKVFPGTEVQLCLVHQVRTSMKYLCWRDLKSCINDLKKIFTAKNIRTAATYFDETEEKWIDEYSLIFNHWRNNWVGICSVFQYPPALRKVLYTTHPIESYHRMVKKITSTKGAFSFESIIVKKIYEETNKSTTKWRGMVFNWAEIHNDLNEYFSHE